MEVVVLELAMEPGEHMMLLIVLPLRLNVGSFGHPPFARLPARA